MFSLSRLRPLLPRLPLRYVIAGRHQLICEGIRALLDECPDLECAACVSDGRHLMKTLCVHQPDILLTGLLLEGVSPLAILRQCRICMPQMGIVVVLLSGHPLAVTEAARAGAHAFVSKNDGRGQLLETVFRVAVGQRGLFPKEVNFREPELNGKERTVLCGIVSGMTTEKIAKAMRLGVKMVELYRTRLLRRFNVRKSTDLVRIAFESGIFLRPEEEDVPLCRETFPCGYGRRERLLRATADRTVPVPSGAGQPRADKQ